MPSMTGMFQSRRTTSGIRALQAFERDLAILGFSRLEFESLEDALRDFAG